ncbi:TonB-dependent siderophore receptor [Noviherbaspirillum sp. CPCC 100848]|uniref:TonB-dependent siderophore receptor n=1 Tax=Noviherbaspirillum album TaxID=3080276 RepID=A0ABU6J2V3_9BURK|nr:TonB-dependent siderophore receptor [Noviherbaspirillum sp. CPCC 100848]MEC4717932.1 TonB-dependent siderophore receptor [Noviherbaspirillum sp. CPCC 100848]
MTTSHTRHAIAILTSLPVLAGASIAQAQQAGSAETVLPSVSVSAPRISGDQVDSAGVAAFGQIPLHQTPAAVSVITRGQMQERGIRQTTDVLRLDASLNEAYNAIGYAEQFSIRGFNLDNASSYRKDGLEIGADASIPLENKERIEVLKGLAGLQAGIATPGGIINYVTKRPTAETLRTVTLEARERGTLYGAVDLGGRFDDRRFGYRINAAAEKLRSYVRNADGERQFVSGAFDWRLTPQALLQLDLDYQHKSQLSVPGFQLINGTDLPTGISARTMLNNQPWSRPVKTDSANVGLRLDVQFNPDWNASVAINRHAFRRDDFAAFPFGCAAGGLFFGFCANGDFDVYDYQSENENKSLLTTQAMLQGRFATGGLAHAATVGVSTLRRRDEFGDCVYGAVDCLGSAPNGSSNLYNPVAVPASTIATGPVRLRRSGNEHSLFANDVISLSESMKLHAGVRYTHIEREQYDPAGLRASNHDRGYFLPNVALAYSPRKDWTAYVSYAQGLEHGGIAPLFASNANQALDPSKSKQVEFGMKMAVADDWQIAAALFQIRKPLEYTDADFAYIRNGDAEHRGLELSAQGRATRNLTIGASLAALRTRQENTGLPGVDGKRTTNVPKLKAIVHLDYTVPELAGLALNGSWQYAGNKAFNPDNSVTVPGYHLFNIGARYSTRVGGMATTLRAGIDNVADKFYWRDVTQSLGGYLFPGAPRTFRVSAQFDF